jgi:hypothetical protein
MKLNFVFHFATYLWLSNRAFCVRAFCANRSSSFVEVLGRRGAIEYGDIVAIAEGCLFNPVTRDVSDHKGNQIVAQLTTAKVLRRWNRLRRRG